MNDIQARGPLPVTNLKQVFTSLSQQARVLATIDGNQDGKISTTEGLSYAVSVLPMIPMLYTSIKEAGPELLDVKGPEYDEIVSHIQTLDFLPDSRESVEKYIKVTFMWLNMNRKFTEYSIATFRGEETDFEITFSV